MMPFNISSLTSPQSLAPSFGIVKKVPNGEITSCAKLSYELHVFIMGRHFIFTSQICYKSIWTVVAPLLSCLSLKVPR